MSFMSELVTARRRAPSQNSTLTESPAYPERLNRIAVCQLVGGLGLRETAPPAEPKVHAVAVAISAMENWDLVFTDPPSARPTQHVGPVRSTVGHTHEWMDCMQDLSFIP
jgi:hypothetical protein